MLLMMRRLVPACIALAAAVVFGACSSATAAPGPDGHRVYAGNVARDTGAPVSTGRWGGDHVRMVIAAVGATLEFDCAHGTIAEALVVNAAGQFAARGEFVREHGGPIRDGELPDAHAALYTGAVDGDRMHLTITLSDGAAPPATYSLTRGATGAVFKCL